MATRTELILLQRTMVVVEGVTRTLDPQANIFEAAGPVVEDYIRGHLGPGAMARDLAETARIVARLGPRLPGLAAELLMRAEEIRTQRGTPASPVKSRRGPARWVALGAALGAAATWLLFSL